MFTLLSSFALIALFQGLTPNMSLEEFLVWLTSSAGAIAAVSFILEKIDRFQSLESSTKSLLVLGLSVVVSLVAFAIINYVPKEILERIGPYFALIYGVVYTWITSQVVHAVRVKVKTSKSGKGP